MKSKTQFFSLMFKLVILAVFLGACKTLPGPEMAWETKSDNENEYFYGMLNQPAQADEFLFYNYQLEGLKLKETTIVTIDSQTGKIKKELVVPKKESNKKFGEKDRLLLISNYLIKIYADRLHFFNFNSMQYLYSIEYEADRIIIDIIDNKGMIIINKFLPGKNKRLSFYNLSTGREIFDIKYKYRIGRFPFFNNPFYEIYYEIYAEQDIIAIFEDGRHFTLFSLLDGSRVGKIEDGIKGDLYEVFDTEVEDEKYIVTADPYYLRRVNIKSGRLLSEVKFRNKGISKIGFTLTELDDLVYVTYQDGEFLNKNGLACIDVVNQELKWDKRLNTSHLLNIIELGDDIITFNQTRVLRLNKKTGEEVWQTRLKDPKVVRQEKEGLLVGLGLGKTNDIDKELGFSGFALLNQDSGEIIWQFNGQKFSCITNTTFNQKDGNVYFCDKKTFYILNPQTGQVVSQIKLAVKQPISATMLLEEENKMILFSRDFISLYDIANDEIVYAINDDMDIDYFLFEALKMGNNLIFTCIEPAFRTQHGSTIPGKVYRLLIDLQKGKVIWQKQIGINYYLYGNGLAYYLEYGTASQGQYSAESMFWPRKDLWDKNLFVIADQQKTKLFDKSTWGDVVRGYQMFPEEIKPTKAEINNTQKLVATTLNQKMGAALKRILKWLDTLWKK